MVTNREFFAEGEANQWFERNHKQLSNIITDAVSELANWLLPFKGQISDILEIGCGSGDRIDLLSSKLEANGYGLEPSAVAVDYINKNFPKIRAEIGFGDNVSFVQKFDLVHLGFFLYLVDREYFLRCIAEADRSVKFGGFLSIIDFETPFPYSNKYDHKDGVFSHKQNNSDVFVASGLYSVVNKFQFSHNNFHFDEEIDERVSITLLYKEKSLFGGC